MAETDGENSALFDSQLIVLPQCVGEEAVTVEPSSKDASVEGEVLCIVSCVCVCVYGYVMFSKNRLKENSPVFMTQGEQERLDSRLTLKVELLTMAGNVPRSARGTLRWSLSMVQYKHQCLPMWDHVNVDDSEVSINFTSCPWNPIYVSFPWTLIVTTDENTLLYVSKLRWPTYITTYFKRFPFRASRSPWTLSSATCRLVVVSFALKMANTQGS